MTGGPDRLTPFRYKNAVKKLLYYACGSLTHFSGVGGLRSLPGVPNSLRVLMYHKVNDQVGNSISVPPALFGAQMGHLNEHYTTISADLVVDHVDAGAPLPPRAVLLTFDDGYRDNYTKALPILQKYGHRAVLFLATEFISSSMLLPHDRAFSHLSNPPLSWADLGKMQEIFEIGSHGHSHIPLARLSPERARREIVDSKNTIEDKIGRAVRLFSYPKGGSLDFNERIREFVREAGYRLCFTTLCKTNTPPLDPLALGRYHVEPYSLFYFRCLLDGSCDLMGLKNWRYGAYLKRCIDRALGVRDESTDG